MQHENTVRQLNKTKLQECTGLLIGDILYYPLDDMPNNTRGILYKALGHIAVGLILSRFSIITSGDGSTLVLFSNSYRTREDHFQNFQDFLGLLKNYTAVVPGKKRMALHRLVPGLRLIGSWNKQLAPILPSLPLRLYCIGFLLEACSDYKDVTRALQQRSIALSRLISYSDTHHIDSFFTQMYNNLGGETITLQHGTFAVDPPSWSFRSSHSKFFLANSRYALYGGELAGYQGRMLLTGPLSGIKRKGRTRFTLESVNRIGVFLDGGDSFKDNLRMLSIVGDYCSLYDKELYVKLHPSDDASGYRVAISSMTCVTMIYEREISVVCFCECVDVAVVRNSTVLIEALQYHTPCVIFHDKEQRLDVYQGLPVERIDSVEAMHEMLNCESIDNIMRQMQRLVDFFCIDDEVDQRYINALKILGVT